MFGASPQDTFDTGSRIAVGTLTIGSLMAALGFIWKVQGRYTDRVEDALARCQEENEALRAAFFKLASVVYKVGAGLTVPDEQLDEVLTVALDFEAGNGQGEQ